MFTIQYSKLIPKCQLKIPDATTTVLEFAEQCGIPNQVVELNSHLDVSDLATSPYGMFSIVHNGQLLAYHYLLPRDLVKIFNDGKKGI